jgi:hypothetical protein
MSFKFGLQLAQVGRLSIAAQSNLPHTSAYVLLASHGHYG